MRSLKQLNKEFDAVLQSLDEIKMSLQRIEQALGRRAQPKAAQPQSNDLTIRQAAAALNVSTKTVRRYMTMGTLAARDASPVDSRRPMWRIPLSAIHDMLHYKTPEKRVPQLRARPYTPIILVDKEPKKGKKRD